MPDAIKSYYETAGSGYRMSSTRRDQVQALLDEAIGSRPKEEKTVVMDIGIGSGEVAKHCRSKFPDRKLSLVGVDISENLLSAHRGEYDVTLAANVDEEGWAKTLSEPAQVVVASELVEHLFRPDIFFKTVRDAMAPGGRLIVTTPNMLLWSQRIRFLLGRHAWTDQGVFEWGHIRLFSWPFLKKQLEDNGFKIVAERHLVHPYFLNRWRRWLPPGLFAFQFVVLAENK